MTEPVEPSADEKLIDLVVRYLDSDLPPVETEQLHALLAADPRNRAVFVDVCLQAKLCTEILGNRLHDVAAGSTPLSSLDPIPIEAEIPSTTSVLLGFLTSSLRSIPGGEVAVGLLVGLAVLGATWGLARLHARLTATDSQDVAVSGGFVATLTACDNCRWGDTTLSTERAARLKAGQLDLQQGVAEVTFDCGARIVLEGPALLTLENSTRASLAIGRIVAHVPPAARGFTVAAPSVTVVDLGTEFGLDVDAAGTAEVQVFQGKVELRPNAAQAGSHAMLLEVAGLARFDVQTGQVKAPLLHAANFVRRVEERISRPPLTLVEEGGRFAPSNLATLPGAWAFGKNVLLGFPHHRIEYLTDGHYGNEHSWIAADEGPSFAGVVLSGPSRIDSIAFGRDNNDALIQEPQAGRGGKRQKPLPPSFRDRWLGSYTIQYSNAPRTNQPPPEESWHTIDTLKYAPDMPEIASDHIHPYLRHRFRFAPVEATAVRIVTSQGGTCIDELEVYGSRLSGDRINTPQK
jgi:hypothetical protein